MNLATDFIYNLRILRKNFAFSLLCLMIITLGTAIALTIFSISDNMGFRTPNVAEKGKLVTIKLNTELRQGGFPGGFDSVRYRYYKDNASSYSLLTAYRYETRANISDGDISSSYVAAEIEPEFLSRTGVQPIMGRGLLPEDSNSGNNPVVLLGYSVWQNYYAGREDIIGHQSRINGELRTVVGVMPEGFGFPYDNDLWLPLALDPNATLNEEGNLMVAGYLKDAVDIDSADLEVKRLASQFNDEFREQFGQNNTTEFGSVVQPYRLLLNNGTTAFIIALLIVTASVVCLVAFNIASLLVARSSERIQELAIRSAVGATPARIAQTLLMESFIICSIGCLLGLLLASQAIQYVGNAFTATRENYLPYWATFALDANLITGTLAIGCFIWLISGLYPALKVLKDDLNSVLYAGSTEVSDTRGIRFTKYLVILEIMVCSFLLVVLITATLSIYSDTRTDFGIPADNFFAGKFNLPEDAFPDLQSRYRHYENLNTALAGEPRVIASTAASTTPGNGFDFRSYNLEDRDLFVNNAFPTLHQVSIADNYFSTFGLSLIAGRNFDNTDSSTSLPVAIADQRMMDAIWPGESPIGKRVLINPNSPNQETVTIIGVAPVIYNAANTRNSRVGPATLYRPFSQSMPDSYHTFIKVSASRDDAASLLQTISREVNRDIAVEEVYPLQKYMQRYSESNMVLTRIISWVCVLAFLLASSAIYALMARTVYRRSGEAAIRKVVGASNLQALSIFFKEGLYMLSIGLIVGEILSIFVTYMSSDERSLSILHWVSPTVALAIFSVLVLSILISSRKIFNMEPGDALRHE